MPDPFTPWPPVNARYGAPMGRRSTLFDLDPERDTIADLAARGPAGEYDPGGAFWGLSRDEGPVWAVWRRRKGLAGVLYLRAHSRAEAKRRALTIIDNLTRKEP